MRFYKHLGYTTPVDGGMTNTQCISMDIYVYRVYVCIIV